MEQVLIPEYAFWNLASKKLFCKELKNCIITRSSLVLTGLGIDPYCLFENLPFRVRLQMHLVAYGSVLCNRFSCLPSNRNYFHVFNIWGTGYHHWLTEVLPKLFLFENLLRDGTILIPSRCPRFVSEVIKEFKFDHLFFNETIFLRNLKLISNPNSGHYNPEHIRLVRERLLAVYCNAAATNTKYIYVSRKNSRGRKVINEIEVEEFLRQQGFDCIELENISVGEQVALFSNCKTLVSIHGAALTNMIFMPKNATVIEFYPGGFSRRDYFNGCYMRLASVLGIQHRYVFAKRVSENRKYSLHDDDIIVDLQELKSALRETGFGYAKR